VPNHNCYQKAVLRSPAAKMRLKRPTDGVQPPATIGNLQVRNQSRQLYKDRWYATDGVPVATVMLGAVSNNGKRGGTAVYRLHRIQPQPLLDGYMAIGFWRRWLQHIQVRIRPAYKAFKSNRKASL